MANLPDLASDSDLLALGEALAAALRAGEPVDGVAPHGPRHLAVGFSGGADSAMLAVAAAAYACARGVSLRLFHVHHGLVDAADDWAETAVRLAAVLALPLDVVRVSVPDDTGAGLEAAARESRYGALAELARMHGVTDILLAHHRDDQAETVMLRLLRGAGLAGMAAMAPYTERDGVRYVRPWLDIDRSRILAAMGAFSRRTGWAPVQDPTNTDPRYTRAAVRTLLAPVLDARWRGWRAILARHARHVAEAVEILDEVARSDFASLAPSADGLRFSLAAWRRLSRPRQAQVLRHWLGRNGAKMPTEARLASLIRSLNELHALGHDRQFTFEHAAHRIRCVRGEVFLEGRPDRAD